MSPHGERSRTPGAKEQGGFLGALVAGCLGLWLVSGCGPSLTPEQQYRQKVLAEIRSAYSSSFRVSPPAHVVITYPVSVERLSELKREELEIVRHVLDAQHVPYTFRRHEDVVVTVEVPGREVRQFQCYDVPEALVGELSGRMLLYLNLDLRSPVETTLHPRAKQNQIRVKVWNDPVSLAGDGTRRRGVSY